MSQKIKPPVSPLMVAGVLLVLLPLFGYMTLERMEKQKEQIKDQVMARGASLIRTFEAGTRTGMLTMRWGGRRIQAMLQETAAQPDVAYIMITDRQGRILAHSDAERVGSVYGAMPDLTPVRDEMARVLSRTRQEGDEPVFEVYKRFVPLKMGFRGRHMHQMMAMEGVPTEPGGDDHQGWGGPDFSNLEEHYIFAGFSMVRLAQMEKVMTREALVRGLFVFAVACTGVIALFAFLAYRSARASLDEVKAFSDTVVQHMPSGLITLDQGLTVTSANRAARQILGEVPAEAFPQMKAMAREVADTGQPVSREVSLGEADALNLDMTASAILDREGNIQGYLFLFRDVTQLRDLIREVQTNKRLAAIGKLAGGVAHEIRNPLSSIKGFATYFGKRYADNETDAKTAGIMVQEVERINRSITQLLEFANPMAVEKKVVEIEPLLRHALTLLAQDLEQKQIRTRVEMVTAHRCMVTDPDRMNQVLLNLYMNAVNAMDPGGELWVEAADLPGEPHAGLLIRVRDNGCGIPAQHLEDIFDPYFTTRPKGTGLGLSIVHRIMENLKGEIRVESTPGKGTCFTLVLPKSLPAGDGPQEERMETS